MEIATWTYRGGKRSTSTSFSFAVTLHRQSQQHSVTPHAFSWFRLISINWRGCSSSSFYATPIPYPRCSPISKAAVCYRDDDEEEQNLLPPFPGEWLTATRVYHCKKSYSSSLPQLTRLWILDPRVYNIIFLSAKQTQWCTWCSFNSGDHL